MTARASRKKFSQAAEEQKNRAKLEAVAAGFEAVYGQPDPRGVFEEWDRFVRASAHALDKSTANKLNPGGWTEEEWDRFHHIAIGCRNATTMYNWLGCLGGSLLIGRPMR